MSCLNNFAVDPFSPTTAGLQSDAILCFSPRIAVCNAPREELMNSFVNEDIPRVSFDYFLAKIDQIEIFNTM